MKLALFRQKLISNFILIASLSLVGYWSVDYVIKNQKDQSNLIALFLGIPGLAIAGWQTLITIENARNDRWGKMIADVQASLTEIRKGSLHQDLRHDQQILDLLTKQSFLDQKIDLHSELFGHPDMIKELFVIKDKINTLNANVAVITQQGRVVHQLDRMQLEIVRLSKTVDDLKAISVD